MTSKLRKKEKKLRALFPVMNLYKNSELARNHILGKQKREAGRTQG